MNSLEFKKQLGNSNPGTRIVYHIGDLAFDRMFDPSLERLAEAVWKAAGMRWIPGARPTAKKGHTDQWCDSGERRVILTQRRLSEPMGFEYIATKI